MTGSLRFIQLAAAHPDAVRSLTILDVTGGAIPECGHFIPEEQPEALAERLLPFLARVPD